MRVNFPKENSEARESEDEDENSRNATVIEIKLEALIDSRCTRFCIHGIWRAAGYVLRWMTAKAGQRGLFNGNGR